MKKNIRRIIISFVIFVTALLLKFDNSIINTFLFVLAYLIVGYDVLLKSFRNILSGQVFDENFLMSIASIGAFIIGENPEAAAVMIFYQVGEAFQSYAVKKSRKSIASLMDIRPDYANLKSNDGEKKVYPDEVKIGNTIIVKPGEKVPLDGVVVKGEAMADTTALTGESVPVHIKENDEILSGYIITNSVLEIKVTKEFGESTVSKILDLVENASNKKSNSENFITKFARVYTPIVVYSALALALIPPLIFKDTSLYVWVYRALTFLVVSCPCALVISVPLSFFGGIGAASKEGILVKGSNYLEALSKAEIAVFDKTGTLTKGVFEVNEIIPQNIDKDELLKYASYGENFSSHPISLSLKRAYAKGIDTSLIKETEEISGHGIKAVVENKEVLLGNSRLMEKFGIEYEKTDKIGTIIYTAIDRKYTGYILISDEIKKDSKEAITELKKMGIKKTVMLTGDNGEIANEVGEKVGIDEIYSKLLPGDKVEMVEKLSSEKSEKGKLIFVGDGINDAPVLSGSDIGIAMGALGSDAAIEAADMVIMTDELLKISKAIKISKKTIGIANQNIVFALSVKIVVLILAAFGISGMWEAVFADVGVAVIAILNALRALSTKEN